MEYEKYRKKICAMLDELFAKPDLTLTEVKNATEAMNLLCKLNEVERGDAMRDQYGNESYGNNYGANAWIASGPYPDYGYGDNYGRQMRSSRTGRYMNGPNSGQTIYGHSIKDRMVASLEDMMDQAHNEYERQEIKNEIQKLRMDTQM